MNLGFAYAMEKDPKHLINALIIIIIIIIRYIILLLYMCCAFVGLDNELYKMHGTYIKVNILYAFFPTTMGDSTYL